jgi:hypothetical protein
MAVVDHWVTLESSSTWISPRSAGARTADSHLYVELCLICSSAAGVLELIANDILQANEHHRKHLEAQPTTSYPLAPTGHPAEVNESQRITDEPLAQR